MSISETVKKHIEISDRICQHEHMRRVLWGYDDYFFSEPALNSIYEALRDLTEAVIKLDREELDKLETELEERQDELNEYYEGGE